MYICLNTCADICLQPQMTKSTGPHQYTASLSSKEEEQKTHLINLLNILNIESKFNQKCVKSINIFEGDYLKYVEMAITRIFKIDL